MILEVERDPKEGIVVALDEGSDVEVPPPCAMCLGEATQRLPVAGANWLELPYCDACASPATKGVASKAVMRAAMLLVVTVLVLLVSLWFGVLALLVFIDLGGPRGGAAKLLLGETDVVRLGFRNEEYARLFVEANGAAMPP